MQHAAQRLFCASFSVRMSLVGHQLPLDDSAELVLGEFACTLRALSGGQTTLSTQPGRQDLTTAGSHR